LLTKWLVAIPNQQKFFRAAAMPQRPNAAATFAANCLRLAKKEEKSPSPF
jgi:hypothetical protein